jgi:hypothetical protein
VQDLEYNYDVSGLANLRRRMYFAIANYNGARLALHRAPHVLHSCPVPLLRRASRAAPHVPRSRLAAQLGATPPAHSSPARSMPWVLLTLGCLAWAPTHRRPGAVLRGAARASLYA